MHKPYILIIILLSAILWMLSNRIMDTTLEKPPAIVYPKGYSEATGWYSTVMGGRDNLVEGKYSIILAGCNITVSKPFILAFGGCEGWPVYEVHMTFRESQILRKIVMRAKTRR